MQTPPPSPPGTGRPPPAPVRNVEYAKPTNTHIIFSGRKRARDLLEEATAFAVAPPPTKKGRSAPANDPFSTPKGQAPNGHTIEYGANKWGKEEYDHPDTRQFGSLEKIGESEPANICNAADIQFPNDI